MPDNKNIQDGRDRSKVSGSEEYEIAHVAKKLGVTADEVRTAIESVGNSREDIEAFIQKNRSGK